MGSFLEPKLITNVVSLRLTLNEELVMYRLTFSEDLKGLRFKEISQTGEFFFHFD